MAGNVNDLQKGIQETVRLVTQRRYDEASTMLNLIELTQPAISQMNEGHRLTALRGIRSQNWVVPNKLKAPTLRPLISIGQAISLVQNRQENTALTINIDAEIYEKYYVRAIAFLKIRNYKEAMGNLELALSNAVSDVDRRKAIATKALVYLLKDSPFDALSTITEDKFYDQNQQLSAIRLRDLEKKVLDSVSLFIISYVFYSCKIFETAKDYLDASIHGGIARHYANYLLGLIYLEQIDSNVDQALSCFELATKIEPNFADAYNGIAVVYAGRGELSKALESVRKSLEIDPNNVTAQENLTKLTIKIEKKNQMDFWEFWNSSGWKRATAIFLSILGIGLVFYGIFLTETPPVPTTISLTNETTTNGTVTSTTITNSTNFSKGQQSNAKVLQELPNSYLILVGIIVIIILIPQIKSAKIGEIEIEMLVSETPTTDTTLRLSYTILLKLEEQLIAQVNRLI